MEDSNQFKQPPFKTVPLWPTSDDYKVEVKHEESDQAKLPTPEEVWQEFLANDQWTAKEIAARQQANMRAQVAALQNVASRPPAIKYCEDCKHYRNTLWMRVIGLLPRCTIIPRLKGQPFVFRKNTDIYSMASCSNARGEYGDCGSTGKLWEPKEK